MKPSLRDDKRTIERRLARRRSAALAVLAMVAVATLSLATSSGAQSWATRILRDARAIYTGAVGLADSHRAHQRRPATVAGRHAIGSKPRGVRKPFPHGAAEGTPPGGLAPETTPAAPATTPAPATSAAVGPATEQQPAETNTAPPIVRGVEPPAAEEPEQPPAEEPETPPAEEPETPPTEEPETPPAEEPETPPAEEPETPPAEEPETPPAEEPEQPPVEEPETPPSEEPESPPPTTEKPFFAGRTMRDFSLIQAAPGAVTEVPDPLGSGERVLRMTVDDGDVAPITPTENPRAEALSPSTIDPGDEFWLQTKVLFPPDFPSVPGWMSLVSVYGPPFKGDSPVRIGVAGDQLQWQRNSRYSYDVPWKAPLPKNRWVTILVHERFASDGFVELWIDGQQVTFFTSQGFNPMLVGPTTRLQMQTMDASNNGGRNYAKIMQYRQAGMFETATVYFGPLLLGASRASVGG